MKLKPKEIRVDDPIGCLQFPRTLRNGPGFGGQPNLNGSV